MSTHNRPTTTHVTDRDGDGAQLPAHGAPAALVEAMSGLPDLESAPAVGELWRLEFDGTAAPVVIAAVGDDDLTVWGVGEDPEFADAATLVLEDDVIGFEVGVWVTLEYKLPAITAERRLAELPNDQVAQLVDIRGRLHAGEHMGGVGARFVSGLDPRVRYREELSRPLSQLASCLDGDEGAAEVSLRQVLDDLGIKRRQLKEHFAPAELEALSSDRLLLQEDEVERLAFVAESRAEYIVAAAPKAPSDLMSALHRPLRRVQLAEKAALYGLSEVDERRRAARTVLAGSMRTAGTGEPDWEAAIDSYLSSR